jgi:hypothetical protein
MKVQQALWLIIFLLSNAIASIAKKFRKTKIEKSKIQKSETIERMEEVSTIKVRKTSQTWAIRPY